jgi:hypothetical protein
VIETVHAESVGGLGNIGFGASTSKIPVRLGTVHVTLRTDWVHQADAFLYNYCPVRASEFVLAASPGSLSAWNVGGTGSLWIENVSAQIRDYQMPALFWVPTLSKRIGGRLWYVYSNTTTGVRTGSVMFGDAGDVASALSSRIAVHPNMLNGAAAGPGQLYDVILNAIKDTYTTVTGAGTWVVDTVNKQVTFINATNIAQYAIDDLLVWRMNLPAPMSGTELRFALQITNIDLGTNTVTCKMLFDPGSYDATYAASLGTNTFVGVAHWAVGSLTLAGCTLTASSTSITNVTNAVTVLRPKDWIKASASLVLCRVVSITGTTVVVSVAAASGNTVNLFEAQIGIRQYATILT